LIKDIYDEQQRLNKTEDEVVKVFFSFESRRLGNERITLILVRDNNDPGGLKNSWAVGTGKDVE
jgi:hypothetical protein